MVVWHSLHPLYFTAAKEATEEAKAPMTCCQYVCSYSHYQKGETKVPQSIYKFVGIIISSLISSDSITIKCWWRTFGGLLIIIYAFSSVLMFSIKLGKWFVFSSNFRPCINNMLQFFLLLSKENRHNAWKCQKVLREKAQSSFFH